jgi:hypothetical protein
MVKDKARTTVVYFKLIATGGDELIHSLITKEVVK